MPVKMDWIIPGQVIYHRWWGVGTLDDMRYANQQSLDLYAQYPDRSLIHTVANAIGQERAEGGLTQIRQIYSALDHPQTGWNILIIDKPLLRFMGNIALQIGRPKARLRFINGIDEWQPFLQERDGTIDWDALDESIILQFEAEMAR